jgi:hypothetical protein
LKGKSEQILKLTTGTVMKMKMKKSAKETGSAKQSEPSTVPPPKTRGQVKAAVETASAMETAAAVGKCRPRRPSKKFKTIDL